MNTPVRFGMAENLYTDLGTWWVDQAVYATGVTLAETGRQQLISALRNRRHLILCGRGIDNSLFARKLSLSMASDRSDHVCLLKGHPWWAARSGDVSRFVELQTEYSLWRLYEFVESINSERQPWQSLCGEVQESPYVVCVDGMSPVEIDLYFGGVVQWLYRQELRGATPNSLRFVGTFESDLPPVLDATIGRVTALVHLDSTTRSPVDGRLNA